MPLAEDDDADDDDDDDDDDDEDGGLSEESENVDELKDGDTLECWKWWKGKEECVRHDVEYASEFDEDEVTELALLLAV